MTKEEFETLKVEHSQSGKTLKDFLKEKGVNYSTYHYWLKKKENEESMGELAPIRFTEEKREQASLHIPDDTSSPFPVISVHFNRLQS